MAKEDKEKINIMIPMAIEKEDDNDILLKYMTIDPKCLCCNLPYFAVKINEAYLSGFSYEQILNQYGEKISNKTGEKISLSMLVKHFSDHFNFKGAAVAEYNRKKGMNNLPAEQQKQMRDIFKVLVDERINDLKVYNNTGGEYSTAEVTQPFVDETTKEIYAPDMTIYMKSNQIYQIRFPNKDIKFSFKTLGTTTF